MKRFPAAILAALLLGFPAAGEAGTSEQVATGPRAVALGGAFTAIADDASAIYWNPAGLALLGHQEISAHHAALFGSDITDNFLTFALPLSPRVATALDWYHSGLDDPELDFAENRFDLAVAARLGSRLSAGITGKFLTRSIDLDGSSVRDGRGVGLDVGVLAEPVPGWTVGLLGQDLFDTRLTYSRGLGSATAYPRTLRLGMAYALRPQMRLAADVDDRWHGGVEILPIPRFALRAGVQKSRTSGEGTLWSLGGGATFGAFRFDYAYESHPVLGGTSHLGLTTAFNFNPALIRIETVETRPLFASLYKTYATRPFGSVMIRNLQDRPLAVRVRVLVRDYMDDASEREVILRPKVAQEVPLTAVFTRSALEAKEDRPIQVELAVTYQSARIVRTERKSARAIAYGPGAIDWAAGVAPAATFVTAGDPDVAAFARAASRVAAAAGTASLPNRNLAFAAIIFSALEELGVSYVPDPNNPFSSVSETAHAVDTVHYPRETLAQRAGDCDDTSVLLAALFENVGIATKLVDAPGHLFMMFDSGVSARNRERLTVDESLFRIEDGTLWIPLETTALGRGFSEAWRIGADEFDTWEQRNRIATVGVEAAQRIYEPSGAPPGGRPITWNLVDLLPRYQAQVDTISAWQSHFLARHFRDSEEHLDVSTEAMGELARVYYLAGSLERAKKELEGILARDPNSPSANNNLGVVLVVLGKTDEALSAFRNALAAEEDPGILLNIGVLRYLTGDRDDAENTVARGVRAAGSLSDAASLLQLEVATPPGVSADDRRAASLLLDAFRQAIGGALPEAGAGTPDAVADRLYWKK